MRALLIIVSFIWLLINMVAVTLGLYAGFLLLKMAIVALLGIV